MTVKDRPLQPFLMQFSERLPIADLQKLRYDKTRQISQVEVDGVWIDTPDALHKHDSTTKFSKVNSETTDDN